MFLRVWSHNFVEGMRRYRFYLRVPLRVGIVVGRGHTACRSSLRVGVDLARGGVHADSEIIMQGALSARRAQQ